MNGVRWLLFFLCINVGFVIVAATGVYDTQTGLDESWFASNIGISLSAGVLAGIVVGTGVSLFTNADTLVVASITGFAAFSTAIVTATHQLLGSYAASLGGGILATIEIAYVALVAILLVLAGYQMATGGWQSFE
jgi:hypothetical protein